MRHELYQQCQISAPITRQIIPSGEASSKKYDFSLSYRQGLQLIQRQ